MASVRRVASVVLGASLLFWSPSVFINDEIPQSWALHGLARGQIWMGGDFPVGYVALKQNTSIWRNEMNVPPGAFFLPSGSFLLNLLALPVLLVLRGSAAAVGVHGALALVAAPLAALGLGSGLSLLGKRPSRGWLAAVAGLLAAPALLAPSPLHPSPRLELAALQLVSMAASCLAAGLMWDLLRRPLGSRAALAVALAYALATPVFFWSGLAKYHALSATLVVAALWCLRDGLPGHPGRAGLAFLFAGLAVTNHTALGVLLLLSLLLACIPWLAAGLVPLLRQGGAALSGFASGILPWLGWKHLVALGPPRPDGGAPAAAGGAGPPGTSAIIGEEVASRFGQVAQYWSLADWQGTLLAIRQSVVWADKLVLLVPALPILALAPYALAAIPGVRDRRLPGALRAACAVYPVLQFALLGRRVLDIGTGFDVRHVLTLWPALLILAAPSLADAIGRRGLRWLAHRAALFAIPLASFSLAFLWLLHNRSNRTLSGFGLDGDLVEVQRLAAPVLCLALLACWALRRWGAPRWRGRGEEGLDAFLACSLASALWLQLLLATTRWHEGGEQVAPFVLAPTGWLAQGFNGILFSHQ